jgi:prepilin-type N-terminal cleavage/methylation domain-containing protein
MSTSPRRRRAGFTLVELIVVTAMLAIVATIGVLALRNVGPRAAADPVRVRIAVARRQALATGAVVLVRIVDGPRSHEALVLPDGSVITDAPGIDRLTGRGTDAAR